MTTERVPHPDDWRPNEGPQTRFLGLTCYEAMLGGSAGGGKTDALLVDAIRYVGRGYGPNHQALLLRKTFPELEKNLVPRAWALYPRLGGVYNQQSKTWIFPDGERVMFGYLDIDKDVYQYQGAAFQFVGFDELTAFKEQQYLYLMSRVRSAHGIPLRVRSATNPGGVGHEWVFKRFGYWLDPDRRCAAPGEVLRLTKDEDGNETVVPKGTPGALGRTFVPAKLSDNPYLASDEVYARALSELDPVTRAQLRDGNWLIKPGRGLYFKRAWLGDRWMSERPTRNIVARCRAWDLGATLDGDWTVGPLLTRLLDKSYVIEDAVRMRGRPAEVDATIKATAQMDGHSVPIILPQDPGQAGVAQVAHFAKLLSGWRVIFVKPTGDKVTRAGACSSAFENGHFSIVKGPWNSAFMQVLEAFPEGDHDDDVDALADAFNHLARGAGQGKAATGAGDRRSMDGY